LDKVEKLFKKLALDYKTFNIQVRMPTQSIPQFLGILEYMETLGAMGSSRTITIGVDGDGAFNAKFKWDKDLPKPDKPYKDNNGNRHYSLE
jgi:hypothetical protein